MTNHKTMRRDTLRKLVESGRVVLTHSYHFDDMLGEDRSTTNMPVAMAPSDWRDRKEGICYMRPDQFTSNCGHAWKWADAEGRERATLIVHSNSNYDFRILPK